MENNKSETKFWSKRFKNQMFSWLPATSYKLQARGGFTILYAVLVAALALTLGLSIYNITIKELELSASGRESQFAFYAADSGIECAFYIDFVGTGFPTSTDSTVPNSVSCGSHSGLVLTPVSSDSQNFVSSFTLNLADNTCAVVTVSKSPDGSLNLSPERYDDFSDTRLESRGQNDCVNLNNPNRVERAIRSIY